jgi:hypothetical protein
MEVVSVVFKKILLEHKENMDNLLQIVVKFYNNDSEVLSLVYNHEIQIHYFDLFFSTLQENRGRDIEFKFTSTIVFKKNTTKNEIIERIADSCGTPLLNQIINVMNPLLL